MKKALSLILALTLCFALAVPALAVENSAANLTPEAAAAYKKVVDSLYSTYGAPFATEDGWDDMPAYTGMCGGYVLDLGDGGAPELIAAFSKLNYNGYYSYYTSYVRVYAWDGTKAVMVDEYQVLASGNGRSWDTYTLCQNGNTAWLEVKWEGLPGYDYLTQTVYTFDPEITYYHLDKGVMKEFTPQTKASSSAVLGIYDYITFNNYSKLNTLLTNAANGIPSTSNSPAVTVGGKAVAWPDATPFIDANGRTMVPLRAVADAMSLTVGWDAASREAVFTDGSRTIYFPIDSSSARTGDGGIIRMDTAAVVINGRTYAPVRYLAEYFGCTVGWDGATRTVTIN